MLNILRETCKQNKYVSIYTDSNNTSKFIFGRILCANSKHIAIYMISPDGCFDGIVVKQTDSVIRLEFDGQYTDKMIKLYSSCELPSFEYDFDEEKIPESLLSIASKTKRIVSLELMNSGYDDVVGFVEESESSLCKIKQVDSYGYEDGFSFVKAEDITQISYDSQDENRILRLWRQNGTTATI